MSNDDDTPRVSEWTKAKQLLIEIGARCPKCGGMDRPGAPIIDIDQGVAVCKVCAASWKVAR
jgi:formate dehydrogenase maturation protein FdhE